MRPAIIAILGLPALLLAGPAPADVPLIKHVVIIVQENRTPDNLFGAFAAQMPGADLASTGVNSRGERIALTPTPIARGFDLDHSHKAFLAMYDHGRMDGADRIICAEFYGQTCPANAPFEYVNGYDVLPYFEIAHQYGFANRMFQTNQGPSFPAHQFILAGTSQLTADSPFFASDNQVKTSLGVGCALAAPQTIPFIGPGGETTGFTAPCFEHQTLPDLLDGHKPAISWRYYTPGQDSIWTPTDSIRHLCQPKGTNCTGPAWVNGSMVLRPAQVLSDITAGNLAQVTWVIPAGRQSDHAAATDGSGPSWVAAIINEIGSSAFWANTVILVTWDDWGGWYDHVRPPTDESNPFNYYELGFRVPLLVVSPYTPPAYISQTQHDFGSLLRFTETVFGLGLIPPGNFADSRADDLRDFFDFTAKPRSFTPIPAPLPASFFINDMRPVTAPDDD